MFEFFAAVSRRKKNLKLSQISFVSFVEALRFTFGFFMFVRRSFLKFAKIAFMIRLGHQSWWNVFLFSVSASPGPSSNSAAAFNETIRGSEREAEAMKEEWIIRRRWLPPLSNNLLLLMFCCARGFLSPEPVLGRMIDWNNTTERFIHFVVVSFALTDSINRSSLAFSLRPLANELCGYPRFAIFAYVDIDSCGSW